MKLYTHPGTCSSASHIALCESGLDFEIAILDLHSDRKLPDGRHLNDINPNGYVPVLEIDKGELLTENIAILQYIADQCPKIGLAPAHGTLERVRLQEWLGFINSELHKGPSILFSPNLPQTVRDMVVQKLNLRLAYTDGRLADKKFLMGDQFTIADAYLFIVLSWAPKLEYDLSLYKNLVAYQAQIADRDTVKRVKAVA